jgi:hypothetical protein
MDGPADVVRGLDHLRKDACWHASSLIVRMPLAITFTGASSPAGRAAEDRDRPDNEYDA